MRVIAGTARSVPLYEVRGKTTRPMTDRVKTSLFSILTPRLTGANVADLFAGTGSLGIEALSRGARSCVFVERDPLCIETIRRNLGRTRLADNAEILHGDAATKIEELVAARRHTDIVLFDPPFRMGKGHERGPLAAIAALACRLLEPTGVFVYHHEVDADGDLGVESLVPSDVRRYGRNVITFLQPTEGSER